MVRRYEFIRSAEKFLIENSHKSVLEFVITYLYPSLEHPGTVPVVLD